MEETSPHGFAIISGMIPILVALRRVDELRPHEETVYWDLKGIVRALERDPILRHPIIADRESGAVLDGTHRVAALKLLGAVTVPTALIDYQNPLVQVDRWFRIIRGESMQKFLKLAQGLVHDPMPYPDADRTLLSRSGYATIRNTRECFIFRSDNSTPLHLCRSAFALEQIARGGHAKIAYSDNDDTVSESAILMSTIRLQKREVVQSCISHVLFPPKSTRHLIPSRPLGIQTPLAWLMDPDVEGAEKKFEKHLSGMTVKRLPEGSTVGSRRYMEEVLLFG